MSHSTPTTADLRARTLNEIVRTTPEALPVLAAFGFDTCCGGALPLEEACQRHGIDAERVVAALRACAGTGDIATLG